MGDTSPDVADLHEYCSSLGIDADQDEDLLWVAHEAFNAPLPASWSEYTNEAGRVYYFHEVSGQSTWEHPFDEVYREVVAIVKGMRAEVPLAAYERREATVRGHLQQVHARALQGLEGWSGPYPSEAGEYYFNELLQVSAWENPVAEWENELAVRHAVLCRCLIPEQVVRGGDGSSSTASAASPQVASGHDLLPSLRLPLSLLRRDAGAGDAPPQTPSTNRSFHTARSTARSGTSNKSTTRSKRSAQSEARARERQERRAAKEQRRAQESQAAAATLLGALGTEVPLTENPAEPSSRVFHSVD